MVKQDMACKFHLHLHITSTILIEQHADADGLHMGI